MWKPIKVVIGAGEYRNNPGWLHTQEHELHLLHESDWSAKFAPDTVAAILAEHVWEHLTFEQGVQAARICCRFLKPGGYIRCAVPDAFFRDEAYQRTVQIGGPGPLITRLLRIKSSTTIGRSDGCSRKPAFK